MVVRAILEKAKRKNKGVRYDPLFLLECVLIRIKSKATYTHLRDNKILPLPDPSTIRKLLSCMPCTFGLNDYALEAISKNLDKLPKQLRYGSFCWDEFAIQEDLTFNSKKLEFDGFVDYGDDGLNIRDKHHGKLADHALVFIFRPYRFGWIQPFACFATKGACPADLLYELMARAITALELHGAVVKSVVCDGAQSNKAVMQMCGVEGRCDHTVNTFKNQPEPSAPAPSYPPHNHPPDITPVPPPDLPPNLAALTSTSTLAEAEPPLNKRKRGRPPKRQTLDSVPCSSTTETDPSEPPPKKKRGRPRKPPSTSKEKTCSPDSALSISQSTLDANLLTRTTAERLPTNDAAPTVQEKRTTAFDHPLREATVIYFFIDVPHIIKCIRNHIFNKKYVQVM